MRTRIRLWLLAVILAPLIPVVAGQAPASATNGTGILCSAFGANQCVGGDVNNFGENVIAVNQPGRTVQFNPGLCNGCVGIIHSTTSGACISPQSSSSDLLVWDSCSRTGVSWKYVNGPTAHYFINVHYGTYFGTDNVNGDLMASVPNPTFGWSLQWRGPA